MRHLFLALCFLTLGPAMAEMPRSAGPPGHQSDRSLDQALQEAGPNRPELEKALSQLQNERLQGLQFLIRFMPEKDLKSLNADFLLENLEYAFRARAAHDWAQQVPLEIFFNEVLPYASLNVRRDAWRKDFYQRFSPKVADAKSLREAAMSVNQSIRGELKVEYNTRRKKADQSPYESMESGMASCTGLSILLCDALRSVGIPARIAGVPSWTAKRGNHNWVEFYDPASGQWHFTEYYPDPKGFDHGWLLADAAKADNDHFFHAIYATSWKATGLNFPMIWAMDNNSVPGVKVSPRYFELAAEQGLMEKPAFELRIEFRGPQQSRQAIPVELFQGNEAIAKGTTPKETDDANRFLSFSIDPTKSYHLRYQTAAGEARTRVIEKLKTDPKEPFLKLSLD